MRRHQTSFSILILLLLYISLLAFPRPAESFSLFNAISQSKSSENTPTKSPLLAGQIGYLAVFHLPSNYFDEYLVAEQVFSRELYVEKSCPTLSGETTYFVPSDYRTIIESTVTSFLQTNNINMVRYDSVTSALAGGAAYVLMITPLNVYVKDESKAVTEINFTLVKPDSLEKIWSKTISTSINKRGLPSTLKGNLIVTLGSLKYDFQPQRALVAQCIYDSAKKFLNQMACYQEGSNE